jgi:hypothetical protein
MKTRTHLSPARIIRVTFREAVACKRHQLTSSRSHNRFLLMKSHQQLPKKITSNKTMKREQKRISELIIYTHQDL